ncbi:unnamed protein product [Meganyctiphanes norvegica]|uniref:Uncharacterized protein n=1 Tax=Meganyctiphanes norvegica TaxID=48144 RepID=A0AAV2PK96_MEGNR
MRLSVVILLLLIQVFVNHAQDIKQTKPAVKPPSGVHTLPARLPQTKPAERPQNPKYGPILKNNVQTLPYRLPQTKPATRPQIGVRPFYYQPHQGPAANTRPLPRPSRPTYTVYRRPTNYQVPPGRLHQTRPHQRPQIGVRPPQHYQTLPGRLHQTRPLQRYPKHTGSTNDYKTHSDYRTNDMPNECQNSCVNQPPKTVGICCRRHNQCCYQGYF